MLEKIRPYFYLMRLHRLAGTWLLLFPTLMALWIAGQGKPDLKWIVLFTLGVFIMRSAGCVINDIADRNFDGHVQRTKERPLVTGEISLAQAKWLFFSLIFLAFTLILWMSTFVKLLAVVGFLLAMSYPFFKRFTHFPQVILGLAFAWGIPMAFAAQMNRLPLACWILFLATAFWIIAFDTLYAMADKEDDLKIGVKSTAIAFGKYDKILVLLFQIMMLLCLVGLGHYSNLHWPFYLSLIVAFGLMLYQQWLVKDRSRTKCLQAFINNQWVGLIVFLGIIVGS